MTNPIRIPPLPLSWPYQPRTALPPVDISSRMSIPSSGEGWTTEGVPLDMTGQERSLERAFGRGGVRRINDMVVRPYRRGGWMAKVNGRRYASADRFRNELAVHRTLWEAGFPTVEPLAIAWRKVGLGVEGLYFTRFSSADSWPDDWSVPLMKDLLKAIRALSEYGLWAPDLNATNVMWNSDGLVLLDWDRATWRETALLRPYRDRLCRSLNKLGAPKELLQALDHGLLGMRSSRS